MTRHYSVHLDLLQLLVCTIGVLLINTSCFGQLSASEQAFANKEWKHLESLKNTKTDTDTFLIDPIELVPNLYIQPHWWTSVKDEFNYREQNIPRGIVLMAGDPENVPLENPETWDPNNFYALTSVSLSSDGRVLEHVYIDSTVFFYDDSGQLRQTTSYSDLYSDGIAYTQLYTYDPFGNILWSANFLYDDAAYYLNQYETFRYFASDSGLNVRQDIYLVNDTESEDFDHSILFHCYTTEGQKNRIYEGTLGEATRLTRFEYQEVNQKLFESDMKEFDLLQNGKVVLQEITRRDENSRIVFEKLISNDGIASYEEVDSTVYISDQEVHRYYKRVSGPYTNARIVSKFDAFGNIERREIYDLNEDNPNKIDLLTTYTNSLLENGTVANQIIDVTYWDSRKDTDVFLYNFLSKPSGSHDPTCKDNPVLIDLIEKCIPPDKR